MKELKTIRGETMIVDDEDYEKAKQYKWYINMHKGRKTVLHIFYNKEKHRGGAITYKKLIMGIDAKLTLYKNDNPLDLRRENILEYNTLQEGMAALQNKYSDKIFQTKNTIESKRKRSLKAQIGNNFKKQKTDYIGVEYRENLQRPWRVRITKNRKTIYLTSFTKSEHAALAYDQKVLELYGNEAKRNFPNFTLDEINKKMNKILPENKLHTHEILSKMHQGSIPNRQKTSIYVGVCYDKHTKSAYKWKSYITRDKITYRLGNHYTEESAAKEYDKKAIELYGEEAKLNFPKQ